MATTISFAFLGLFTLVLTILTLREGSMRKSAK